MGVTQEWLGQGKNRIGTNGNFIFDRASRQNTQRANAKIGQKRHHLIFHHIGQGANDDQFPCVG